MALDDILVSIKDSFETTRDHLLSQAEYEAGQILVQKKASLEEWKRKELALWKEKIERETKNEFLHVDILIDQQKKKYLYEESLRLFETTMDEVFFSLREKRDEYIHFLVNCIQKSAKIWETHELTIFLNERDVSLFEKIQKGTGLVLTKEVSHALSGGVICRYGQEEIDYS
ncbi:MAG: hypothetical protein ACK4TN_02700, partial [Brevinematales bacterium]